MPHKSEFDPDLVRVNIKRKDHDEMLKIKRYHEPYYSMIHRIWQTYNTEKGEIEYMYNEQVRVTQSWMKRALEAEKQLGKQTRLVE